MKHARLTDHEVLQARTMLALRFKPTFVATAFGVSPGQLWNRLMT